MSSTELRDVLGALSKIFPEGQGPVGVGPFATARAWFFKERDQAVALGVGFSHDGWVLSIFGQQETHWIRGIMSDLSGLGIKPVFHREQFVAAQADLCPGYFLRNKLNPTCVGTAGAIVFKQSKAFVMSAAHVIYGESDIIQASLSNKKGSWVDVAKLVKGPNIQFEARNRSPVNKFDAAIARIVDGISWKVTSKITRQQRPFCLCELGHGKRADLVGSCTGLSMVGQGNRIKKLQLESWLARVRVAYPGGKTALFGDVYVVRGNVVPGDSGSIVQHGPCAVGVVFAVGGVTKKYALVSPMRPILKYYACGLREDA